MKNQRKFKATTTPLSIMLQKKNERIRTTRMKRAAARLYFKRALFARIEARIASTNDKASQKYRSISLNRRRMCIREKRSCFRENTRGNRHGGQL